MNASPNRRNLLKGAAISAPLALAMPATAFANSVTPPDQHNPAPNPSPSTPTTPSYPDDHAPLPDGCTDNNWHQDIPCAHFTDQSNGEGWNWFARALTLTLDSSAGTHGYDVQCYLVPVTNSQTRPNCPGNAAERFNYISKGPDCTSTFSFGSWTFPKDVSGLKLPYCYDGTGKGRQTITLPHGSIMLETKNLRFNNWWGTGQIKLNMKNRYFCSSQSWVKAIWVIKNKALGHWHVLDTVGVAGNGYGWGGKYDGIF